MGAHQKSFSPLQMMRRLPSALYSAVHLSPSQPQSAQSTDPFQAQPGRPEPRRASAPPKVSPASTTSPPSPRRLPSQIWGNETVTRLCVLNCAE